MGEYSSAAVCKRGHVQTSDVNYGAFDQRCPRCGGRVLTACTSCQQRIRGTYVSRGGFGGGGSYEPPDFCDRCAAPFPWVSRQGRIYELENLLDDEDLDPADELAAREQLQALVSPDLAEEDERKRWERVRKAAPGLWEKAGARSILDTVISAAIKSQLGL
jgi:hypothetical protein